MTTSCSDQMTTPPFPLYLCADGGLVKARVIMKGLHFSQIMKTSELKWVRKVFGAIEENILLIYKASVTSCQFLRGSISMFLRGFFFTTRQTHSVMAYLSLICRPNTARQTHSRPWESAQIAWNRSRRRTEGNHRAWEDEDGRLHNSQSAGSTIRRADVRHFNPHLKGLSVA